MHISALSRSSLSPPPLLRRLPVYYQLPGVAPSRATFQPAHHSRSHDPFSRRRARRRIAAADSPRSDHVFSRLDSHLVSRPPHSLLCHDQTTQDAPALCRDSGPPRRSRTRLYRHQGALDRTRARPPPLDPFAPRAVHLPRQPPQPQCRRLLRPCRWQHERVLRESTSSSCARSPTCSDRGTDVFRSSLKPPRGERASVGGNGPGTRQSSRGRGEPASGKNQERKGTSGRVAAARDWRTLLCCLSRRSAPRRSIRHVSIHRKLTAAHHCIRSVAAANSPSSSASRTFADFALSLLTTCGSEANPLLM